MMIPIFERKTYLKKPIPLKFIIDFFFISGAVTNSRRFSLSVQFLSSIDRSAGKFMFRFLICPIMIDIE